MKAGSGGEARTHSHSAQAPRGGGGRCPSKRTHTPRNTGLKQEGTPKPAPAQADREDETLSGSQTQDKRCVTPYTCDLRQPDAQGRGSGGE